MSTVGWLLISELRADRTAMTSTAPQPAPAESAGPARNQVYAWLRDAIISGEIEGGRFLDEQ